MEWNVYWYDPNKKEIKIRNIFDLSARFNDELKTLKFARPVMTKTEFKMELAKIIRYCFWAKCEYELVLSSWPDNQGEMKIDIFYQLTLNWESFSEYVWNNL